MNMVTIAIRLVRDDPTLRYLYAHFVQRDPAMRHETLATDRASRSQVFYTTPSVERAGWFRSDKADELITQLLANGVYAATVWARSEA